ncbi:MAG TPA: hypothetical protein VL137_11800 [Polyangiaceae bacterium]|nr:hypothetical protein [Polyangiaceae bacterium]
MMNHKNPGYQSLFWLSLLCVAYCRACGDSHVGVEITTDAGNAGGGSSGHAGRGGNAGHSNAGSSTAGHGNAGTSNNDSGLGGVDAGSLDAAVADADAGPDAAGPDGGVLPGVCPVDDGKCIFRNETFGDEQYWTDILGLQEVVQALTPTAALGVGLKVDADAVPPDVLAAADLTAPETTAALLSLNAVVGVRATVENGQIMRIGITCALCHSTVDNSIAPGIGSRLDGWPNRDLDPGAIIAMTPGVDAIAQKLGVATATAISTLNSWGPGRYDARYNQDGESFPVEIPPAYGLADVALETYTGEGPVTYWNNYVAVTQMGAQGSFHSDALNLDIVAHPDLVGPRLPALRDYQFSLKPPPAPVGTFSAAAAVRGDALFAQYCESCHVEDTSFTDAPTLHDPTEVGTDTNEARRSLTGKYRTTPIRGAWSHPPYFHDGSAETLRDLVIHYDAQFGLGLTGKEQQDLTEYLKSL